MFFRAEFFLSDAYFYLRVRSTCGRLFVSVFLSRSCSWRKHGNYLSDVKWGHEFWALEMIALPSMGLIFKKGVL